MGFRLKYHGYPGGGPKKNESLRDYARRLWADVPANKRALCVAHLQSNASFISAGDEVRSKIAADPEDWIAPYHFVWGMWVRNELRDVMPDHELPIKDITWDDYYQAVVEEALNVWCVA